MTGERGPASLCSGEPRCALRAELSAEPADRGTNRLCDGSIPLNDPSQSRNSQQGSHPSVLLAYYGGKVARHLRRQAAGLSGTGAHNVGGKPAAGRSEAPKNVLPDGRITESLRRPDRRAGDSEATGQRVGPLTAGKYPRAYPSSVVRFSSNQC